MQTCDKHGRPIYVGDVLKVFHFTGARRKKHFMYKHVVGDDGMFLLSHLNLKPASDADGGYWLGKNEGKLDGYEIVQSVGVDCEDRPKITPAK